MEKICKNRVGIFCPTVDINCKGLTILEIAGMAFAAKLFSAGVVFGVLWGNHCSFL